MFNFYERSAFLGWARATKKETKKQAVSKQTRKNGTEVKAYTRKVKGQCGADRDKSAPD